tara:strand:+ start:28408 stop:30165 length:1758 start_codon:yes stop_codon:yes gene_type:complete
MQSVIKTTIGIIAALTPALLYSQSDSFDWPSQNLNNQGTRYAELDQIDRSNVSQLTEAWTYSPGRRDNIIQVTPLVADGVMYLHSPNTMVALDATTGTELWRQPLDAGSAGGTVRASTYADGRVYAYRGADLYAFDADTGEAIRSFGDAGVVKVIVQALDKKYPDVYPVGSVDPVALGYRLTTPPTIQDGKMYVAAALSEGHIPGGLVIRLDLDSGTVDWVFNTIPQTPSDSGWELARDTWGTGQRVGGGVWTPPTIDAEMGLLYFNVANPSPGYEGSSREGSNLFTNSTVALHLDSGELAWHFQAIHHDIWDFDHATGPLLFDVTNDEGEVIKGVAAASKSCLFFMWHRETGEPLFPMVETLVSTETDVPGEVVYPTQPIPYNARGVPMDPLCATFIPFDDAELAARSMPLYTPYSVTEPYIVAHGGPSYGSPSFSPRTNLIYITGKNAAISLNVKPVGDTLTPGPDARGHTENYSTLDRLADEYPPNMTVSAYSPLDGELVWQSVLPTITSIGASGNLVTSGDLLFQGLQGGGFYGLDAENGETLFQYQASSRIRATPMTYAVDGKQYISVIASNTVVTLALP